MDNSSESSLPAENETAEKEEKPEKFPHPDKDDLRPGTIVFDIFVCFAAALLVSASLYYFRITTTLRPAELRVSLPFSLPSPNLISAK